MCALSFGEDGPPTGSYTSRPELATCSSYNIYKHGKNIVNKCFYREYFVKSAVYQMNKFILKYILSFRYLIRFLVLTSLSAFCVLFYRDMVFFAVYVMCKAYCLWRRRWRLTSWRLPLKASRLVSFAASSISHTRMHINIAYILINA